MASVKHLVDLDLNGNELQNAALHTVANPTDGVIGQIVYNTAANAVFVSNGTSYSRVGLTADGSTITDSNGTISVGSIAIGKVTGLQTALDGKVDDSQVLTNVPAGAVFTDTTYSVGNGGLTEINFTTALNTKLSGIEAGATNTADPAITTNGTTPSLASGITAAEVRSLIGAPSTGDIANFATTSYVDQEISSVLGAAPAALDTLDELAAALGDDANFAATMTTALAGKLSTSHDMTLTLAGDATGSATFTNMGNATLTVSVADDSHNHTIANVDGLQTALDGKLNESAYTATDILTKIKTVDGAGSGLDADLLDGNSSAYYINYNNLTNKPDIPAVAIINVSGEATPVTVPLAPVASKALVQVYETATMSLVMTEITQVNDGEAVISLDDGVDYTVIATGRA